MKYIKIWIAVSVAAAGLWFLATMVGASSNATFDADDTFFSETDCKIIRSTVLEMDTGDSTEPLNRRTTQQQHDWLAGVDIIINAPACFPTNVIAQAQSSRRLYLGH
jgi:hypothetical protein